MSTFGTTENHASREIKPIFIQPNFSLGRVHAVTRDEPLVVAAQED